jgi:type IV secretory pathway VirB10-like protein
MRWLTDNLQLVLAVAGALAWWLTQRKQAAAEAEPPPHEEKSFEDPELADRTRRIREEIQRKIEQRARGYAHEQPKPIRPEPVQPEVAELPPVLRELFQLPEPPPVEPRAATRQEAQRQAEILEQQAALAEKLREAELMKAAAQKRQLFEAATADHRAEKRAETRGSVLGELRTPQALRRAFLLREVLGPPVALRR